MISATYLPPLAPDFHLCTGFVPERFEARERCPIGRRASSAIQLDRVGKRALEPPRRATCATAASSRADRSGAHHLCHGVFCGASHLPKSRGPGKVVDFVTARWHLVI